MPVEGVEPTRPRGTGDFESPASAIPPHRLVCAKTAELLSEYKNVECDYKSGGGGSLQNRQIFSEGFPNTASDFPDPGDGRGGHAGSAAGVVAR